MKKPLDETALEQAEYWLLKAGYRGLLGAFIMLKQVSTAKLIDAKVEKKRPDDEAMPFTIQFWAYDVSLQRLLPEIHAKPCRE